MIIKLNISFVLVLSLLLFINCKNELPSDWVLEELSVDSKQSGSSNLYSNGNEAYISWVEYEKDSTDVLNFASFNDGKWSQPNEIARGSNWFVNWADFPSIVAFKDGKSLAAHWLQKSDQGTYNYDVRISISNDKGKQWGNSFILHMDGVAAEHGFVKLQPTSDNQIFATWLDGRFTKGHEASSHDHGHGSGGPMTLRSATFDDKGRITEEVEMDNRVCDCCQTDATIINSNPVVVYRDRSEEEIRDISVVRKSGTDWFQPKQVHNDGWHIAGCPVNGPAIASTKDKIAVAWFSILSDTIPVVQVSFSTDQGNTFSSPVRIDEGEPLGRVDVLFVEEDKVVVSWIEGKEDQAEIRIAEVKVSGLITYSKAIVETNRKRSSGFPVMAKYGNDILMTWTEVNEESTVIKSGILRNRQ